ncbi:MULTISPECIES: hypothetical protein [Acetobacter]|uniref:Uncharacterized protein n=1 Tax=Acetobacter cerevisiae TaxID=178900 RepID=A0A149USZ7_9PROT|nr:MULTISPECIES: hypothetical protein [Acetobacter]KXU93416.1 hypothetical protein AD928_08725 [Acetobacter cerevisiae]KXV71062.1 hypothetical protein AD952_10720 [Acetobacter cerevisiae]KXV78884.1 hypothetical protein AD954_00035 [Acetobacter cerevisiae]MCP1245216.1 hypothetical protein [Acetobacter cerevisiae]MCP1254792.1 hypothetical protein [Acetobacter cerevisiae]
MTLRIACLLGILACVVVRLIDFHYQQTCMIVGGFMLFLAVIGTLIDEEPPPVKKQKEPAS